MICQMIIFSSTYCIWLTPYLCRSYYRIRLLQSGQRDSTVWFGSSALRPDGHVRLRLPHGQHGPSSLRDVQSLRQRHFPTAPGSRSRLRTTIPRRTLDPGSDTAVLPDPRHDSGDVAQVISDDTLHNRRVIFYICLKKKRGGGECFWNFATPCTNKCRIIQNTLKKKPAKYFMTFKRF